MDEEIVEFIRSRHTSLLRRAFLLTGNAAAAEDLVQDSLARLWLSWSRHAVENPDAYVRRLMVNSSSSTWRKRRHTQTVDRTSPPCSPRHRHPRATSRLPDSPHRQPAARRGSPPRHELKATAETARLQPGNPRAVPAQVRRSPVHRQPTPVTATPAKAGHTSFRGRLWVHQGPGTSGPRPPDRRPPHRVSSLPSPEGCDPS